MRVPFNRRIANAPLTPWTGYIADLKLHVLLRQWGLEGKVFEIRGVKTVQYCSRSQFRDGTIRDIVLGAIGV
jgi:hypothetical protein